MSNYTILEQNTLLGFEHDDTKALYLRGASRDELHAFTMADQWEKYLRPWLHKFVPVSAARHAGNPHALSSPEAVSESVIEFMKERHFRSYFPDGRSVKKSLTAE